MEIKIGRIWNLTSIIILLLLFAVNSDSYCFTELSYYSQQDSIVKLKNQAYVIYHYEDEQHYKIIWGNNYFESKSSNVFERQGNGLFNVYDYNDNVIVLEQSSGPSIKYSLILPLKNGEKEQSYINPLTYNLSKNLIVYSNDSTNYLFSIKNFMTGNEIQFSLSDICPSVVAKDCIRKISFNDNNLIIVWEGKKWDSDNDDLKKMEIAIKF